MKGATTAEEGRVFHTLDALRGIGAIGVVVFHMSGSFAPFSMPGGYLADDPESEANRRIASVVPGDSPVVRLDGECYVFATSRAVLQPRGAMRYCAVVSPSQGALFQSQFYAELDSGVSPVISADQRHTVLFVTQGEGEHACPA